jgi:uncharacterized membrane protein
MKGSGKMRITRTELACIGIFLVLCGVTTYFYPQMPEQMACHWDIRGQVNGFMPKSINMFICPLVLAVFIVVLTVVPRVASVAANIEGFRKFYGGLVIFFSVFFLVIQYQMILWNLGIKINPGIVILPMTVVLIGWILFLLYRANRQN